MTRLWVWWHEHVLGHTVIVGGGGWTARDVRELRRDHPGWFFTHDIKRLNCSCGTARKGSY